MHFVNSQTPAMPVIKWIS